jgi:hypothetical protein
VTAVLRVAVDLSIWSVLAATFFAATYVLSRKLYPSGGHHRLAASLVAAAFLVGVGWPLSSRVHGIATLREVAAGSPPIAGDTIADGPCRGRIVAPSRSTGNVDTATPEHAGIVVVGWAVSPDATAPVDAVCTVLDDRLIDTETRYGLARPDVAQALGNPNLVDTGFSILVPATVVTAGTHTLTIVAKTASTSAILGTESVEGQ